VPSDQLENSLREHRQPTTHVDSPYTCLVVKNGKRTLLIDTGAGAFAPTTGDLLKNLEAEGISAKQITDVVLTHAHPDHIGGVLGSDGKPAFANACYWMSRAEWDFWNGASALHHAIADNMKEMLVGCAQKNLPPLKTCIELFDGEKEIAPGVRTVAAPGHTPGHTVVMISSGNAQLLFLSDTVLHPLHLENPGWRNVFDLSPEEAAKTRRKLADRAAADKMKVLAYHFPFPGMGLIESKGAAWKWEAGV
jgi:glyoxylase-like metal-dependent hydrolase (beta-lactamase superfamily II)